MRGKYLRGRWAHEEELRPELDLVEHDQPGQVLQGEEGIVEAVQVAGALEVEPRHIALEAGGEGAGERGLADLAGADQADDRELPEEQAESLEMRGALDHGGILP